MTRTPVIEEHRSTAARSGRPWYLVMMNQQHTGGCLCGQVRYRFAAYADAGFCHCRMCQRASGSPVTAWAHVPDEAFTLEAGAPAEYPSSDAGTRCFCARCGTGLYFRDHERTYYSVNLGSLDVPGDLPPRLHMCVESQIAWMKTADLLPVFEGNALPSPDHRTPLRGPADPAVSASAQVSLREITAGNVRDVLLLDVTGGQRRFVALNKISLAQALFAPEAWYRAVYAGDTPVGFAMLERLDDDLGGIARPGEPFLWRFMIDERYQGLGIGRQALDAIVTEVRAWDGPGAMFTSCVPGTGGPLPFYQRAGFCETGTADEDGELYLRLPLGAERASNG